MEHDWDLDFAMACLRLGQAKLRNERQRFLALEQLYAGMDGGRVEAVLRHADRTVNESKSDVRDLLMKQRLSLERRFARHGSDPVIPSGEDDAVGRFPASRS